MNWHEVLHPMYLLAFRVANRRSSLARREAGTCRLRRVPRDKQQQQQQQQNRRRRAPVVKESTRG